MNAEGIRLGKCRSLSLRLRGERPFHLFLPRRVATHPSAYCWNGQLALDLSFGSWRLQAFVAEKQRSLVQLPAINS